MTQKLTRQSNFELLRIIFMFLIVIHHYCINSGFLKVIHDHLLDSQGITFNMLLIQFASFGGKVGVNGFFIISGYFMITGGMKINKIYRLLSTVLFYNIVVFIFLYGIIGYKYQPLVIVKDIIPLLFSVPYSFIASYLLIYLVSDILNKCLKYISQKEFLYLLAILLFYFSILSTFLGQNTFNYFGWGLTMYSVGAYMRLYPLPSFLDTKKYQLIGILGPLVFIWGFILFVDLNGKQINYAWQFLQTDGNKLTVLVMSVSIVLLFKNITIKNNRFVNLVAASCLGVFLIHTNSPKMIHWIWFKLFQNTKYFESPYLWLHMLFAVVSVYVVCTIIDYLRIRYIENPLFNKIEERRSNKVK